MPAKTATVLARVEPDIKEQAEAIMSQLGLPVSVVINMLYKQIILTKSIPFSLSLPLARDEMDQAAFDKMMERGLWEAENGHSRPVEEVLAELRQRMR